MEFLVLYRICVIVSCFFELYFLLDYYKAFHSRRDLFYDRKWEYILYFLCVGINIVINWLDNSLINLAFVQILYFALLVIMFKGNIRTWLVRWLLALTISVGAELILMLSRFIPVDMPNHEIFTTKFGLLGGFFCVLVIKFILFTIVKQVSKSSTTQLDQTMFLNYIIIPFATLGIMILTPYVHMESDRIMLVDIGIICFYILILLGNIRLFYLYENYNYIQEQQMQQQVALARYKEKQWHYDEVETINKRHSVLVHNIKHYLKQIGIYARENSNEEIMETLKDLKIEFIESENKAVCSPGLLNSILVDWREKAKRQEVSTDIFVEVGFKIDYMKGIDVTAILGNILDNALEAAMKCEDGKISAKFFMQNDGAFSILRVKNDYKGEIVQDGTGFLSTKEDKENHGIGVKNVREIIERYDGYVDINYSENEYIVTIVIPVPEEKRKEELHLKKIENEKT